jgi:NAD(P)-dependent dehydrogenase (short-subunit alcohol dehydrogenase family)
VIAGGADGVGRGIALRFALEGARVVIIGSDMAKADFTMRALAAIPAEAKHLVADLGTRADVENAMRQAAEAFGRIDILVNALEHEAPAAALEEIHDDQFARTMTRELQVPLWAMRAALPCMKQQGGGHIINVVSLYGDSTWRAHGDYHAAAEAVKALTRTAAEEWGPHGILVNAIMPAADTPAYQRYRVRHPEYADRLVKDSPLGRMGDPERDIGGAAMLLVSDAGRFLTGHMIHADGGQHLTPSPYEALIPLPTNL